MVLSNKGKYFIPVEHYQTLLDQFKKLKSEGSVGILICSDSAAILKEFEDLSEDNNPETNNFFSSVKSFWDQMKG